MLLIKWTKPQNVVANKAEGWGFAGLPTLPFS